MADTMSQATQPTRLWRPSVFTVVPVLLYALAGSDAEPARDDPATVLTHQQWQNVDDSVDRALAFLSRNQRTDGSFVAPAPGQPAITALCTMAFLSRGHLPGKGRYGEQIDRAIDFVLSTQRDDGLCSFQRPGPSHGLHNAAHAAMYNHPIAGLLLGEAYGMTDTRRSERIRSAVIKAISFTRKYQQDAKRNPIDRGGWRYLRPWPPSDSDLSITAWHLMFLRSARNAEFDVPEQYIDEAMAYVRRTFDRRRKVFVYALQDSQPRTSRAMTGAGILSLSLGGKHQTDMAQLAGQWVLAQSFDQYNRPVGRGDRYHYSAYYCSLAMFQLGGEYWARFYPPLVRTLLRHQARNGSWQAESGQDREFGNCYTTALMVLALTPPYHLLPIYQR